MLRRVGLPHRQHLEQFAVLSGFSDIRTLPRVTFSTNSSRCNATPAVAQVRHTYPSITEIPSDPPTRTPRHKAPSRSFNGKSSTPTTIPHPMPPPKILNVVDDLLSRSPSEEEALKSIRRSRFLSQHLTDSKNVRLLAEAVATSQSPLRSLRILVLAHALGCTAKQSAYHGVVFHLAKQRIWRGVLSVIALGKQHTGRTTTRLLGWRARALVETQDFAALQAILQEYKEQNLTPSRRTFHLILSGHIQNRDLSMAKQCLLAMSEAGIPPDASTHAIAATHHRALGGDPHVETRALEALSSIESRTATAVVNSLIRLRLDSQDLQGALQLLGLFKRRDVEAIFVAIPTGIGNNPTDYTRIPILNPPSPIRQNITPNAATFSIFINYLTTQSNLPAALQILRGMITARISPTTFTVTSLIHIFFSTGYGDIAVRLVAAMCSKTHFRIFKSMISDDEKYDLPWIPHDLSPTIQVFNALLKGLLRTRGLKITDPILRIMQAYGLKPNAATLEILLGHLGKAERSKPGVLFNVLCKFISHDLNPTLRHMHIILGCVLRHEKFLLYGRGWDAVAAKLSQSRQEQPQPYPEHRTITITKTFDPIAGIQLSPALAHRRLSRQAIKSFISRGILSDSAMLALRIRHDATMKREPVMAKEIFQVLLARGMRPNEYHFSGLMEGLVRSGDFEGAVDIMKSTGQFGIKPNVVMFTILISAYARQGNPERAMHIFQQMVSSDIEPDVGSIDAVASAFFAVGAYSKCRRVLVSLWPYIQPFPVELHLASLRDLIRKFRLLAHNYRPNEGPSKEKRLARHQTLKRLKDVWHSRTKPVYRNRYIRL